MTLVFFCKFFSKMRKIIEKTFVIISILLLDLNVRRMENCLDVCRCTKKEKAEVERGIIPFSRRHARLQLHEGCRDQGGVLSLSDFDSSDSEYTFTKVCLVSRFDNRAITRAVVVHLITPRFYGSILVAMLCDARRLCERHDHQLLPPS